VDLASAGGNSGALPARLCLPPADAYLFDIDGTLLNVRDATHYFAFLNAMREVFGVDCNLDGVPVHGNTDIGILRAALRRQGVSDQTFDAAIPQALDRMCAEVVRNFADLRAEPCGAVFPLLQRLQQRGKLLGVVTGNLETIGWAKLEAAGMRHFFQFGCFSASAGVAGDCRPPLPLLLERRADILRLGVAEVHRRVGTAARICAVGDTPSDIEAARELGIPIVAVATGNYSRRQLAELLPDVCAATYEELLEE
jgi:phosphoglycolate phosphatase-like HAD superfamily hydrolase